MKLVSKSGREIELNEQQSAEYLEIIKRHGDATLHGQEAAQAAAFAGELPSQITPEILAARLRAKEQRQMAKRQKRQAVADAYHQQEAIKQSLIHMFPEIPLLVYKRIIRRGRNHFPRLQFGFFQQKPAPTKWESLNAEAQEVATTKMKEILSLLNANDWRRIKPLIKDEVYERMFKYVGVDATSEMM